jgi:hypothetical protein
MISLKYFSTKCTPERKKILSMIGVGILIGLFVCGIPLAVMTTLYLQESKFNNEHSILHKISYRITNNIKHR